MDTALNTPFAHKKHPCILIADEIAPDVPADESVLVARASRRRDAVWVRESALASAREQDAKARVYGFWQTLIASDLVDLSRPLTVYYTGERAGLYLICADGAATRSGRFSGGRLPFELNGAYTLEDASSISVDLETLTPPPEYAHLPSEIISAREKERRSSMVTGLLVGVLVLIVAAGYGWRRQREYDMRAEQMASIKTKQARERMTVASLKKNHRPRNDAITAQQQIVANLLDLSTHSSAITVKKAMFSTGQFVARVSALTDNPPWASAIVPLANGDYAVAYGDASIEEVPSE